MSLLRSFCFVAIALATAAGTASAQDYGYASSELEGFYAGIYGGAMTNPTLAATAGGMAGANFAVTDSVLAGLEVQGGATFGAGTSFDALMLARAGALVSCVAGPQEIAHRGLC